MLKRQCCSFAKVHSKRPQNSLADPEKADEQKSRYTAKFAPFIREITVSLLLLKDSSI
jgi:hypothetical protein